MIHRLISAAFLLLLSACASVPLPPSAPSPLLAQKAPDFRRPLLDGQRFDTEAHRGKVMVIKFFASYCEPCTRTLPDTERLHRAHPDVVVLGINEDEYAQTARDLVSKYDLGFPVIHDTDNVLSGRFRVREMPVTFVLDRQGNVHWVTDSEDGHKALSRAIEEAGR